MKRRDYAGPREFRPVSPWGYVGLSLLYSLPVIGWLICLIVALAGRNVNRRSHARSVWCSLLAVILAAVLACGGLMVAYRIRPAEVPGRVRDLAEGARSMILAALGGNDTMNAQNGEYVAVKVEDKTYTLRREIKETLDKGEAIVDAFVEMAEQGRTGKFDLMGLALTNLGAATKALALRDAELGSDERAYIRVVIDRSKDKIKDVDMDAIDLSWLEDLGIKLPKLNGKG